MEKVTILAGGCFWGIEARFQDVYGVLETRVGFTGGTLENPTYRDVCRDDTGHVEAVEVTYDPEKVSYQQLLEAFFDFHDPTVGACDCQALGSQYRSIVFFGDEKEHETAKEVIAFLDVSGEYDRPIVTEIEPMAEFYPAEEYHQQYYAKHGIKADANCGC